MKALSAFRMSLQSSVSNGEIAASSFDKLRTPRNDDERAFTLTEILVVIAIVAIVGTILVAIFTNTLRGSNKSQILAVIKQNGQSVLDSMDKTLRNADNVICPGSSGDTLVVVKAGSFTRYRYVAPSPLPLPTVNGLIQQDSPTKGALENDTAFIARVCLPNDPMTTPIILTDTNTQSGVSVNVISTLFTRNSLSGFKDSVTVQFTLGPGVAAPAAVASQIDPVTFQTTVQLR